MTEKEYTEFNRKMDQLEGKDDYSAMIDLILSLPKEDLNDDIVSSLGRAYNNNQQFDKAYETLMSVRDSQKEKANWHYRLGYALYYLRRFAEALECFENALEIYVEDEDCIEWINICKGEIEDEAVVDFDLPASYAKFWHWFQENETSFRAVVKNKENIEKDFFDLMAPELKEIKEGIFYLVGMLDDTVDLIFTADGNSRNIVFVEELVAAAPKIDGWKFSAHKPASDGWRMEMGGYDFSTDNISFYSNELAQYPDEIDITIVHNDLTKDNRKEIINGTYIFLDNYLGEIEFLTKIDTMNIIGKEEVQDELIPITKLKSFLNYRQKEFVEKYEGSRYNTQDDNYSMLEANLENGNKLLAVVNAELLKWDSKASHSWIAILLLKYENDGGGMPNKRDYERLNTIEDEVLEELKDSDGYLDIGRQTANGEREIYFACKDFRKPAKIFFQIEHKYSNRFEIEYDIYKDKYWQSFNRFIVG